MSVVVVLCRCTMLAGRTRTVSQGLVFALKDKDFHYRRKSVNSRSSFIKHDLGLSLQPHRDLSNIGTLQQVQNHSPTKKSRVVIAPSTSQDDFIVIQLDIELRLMIPDSMRTVGRIRPGRGWEVRLLLS
jgi:hypothetical protein